MPDVYATARGPLARIASPLAARARARRHERFFALAEPAAGARVLDVGCGRVGLRALEPRARHHRRRPAWTAPTTPARSCAPTPRGLPFADGEFDLVYCSSVIEHVAPRAPGGVCRGGAPGRAGLVRADAGLLVPDRAAFAAARARTGCRRGLRRRYWRLGAAGEWEEISLLRRAELRGAVRAGASRALRPARQELGVRARPDRPAGRGGPCQPSRGG